MNIDLSIILINYNAAKLTKQAVESVLSTTKHTPIEIIVVENGNDSTEMYLDERPNVRILHNINNKGFGHACNIGASKAVGENLLFLNNDTVIHPQTIDQVVEYARSHHKIGALGVRTLLTSGKLDHGCKRGFPTPLASFCYFLKLDQIFPQSKTISSYRQSFVPDDAIVEVDAVSGAFLMVSKTLFEQIGGFDETFFMYGEDLDLCFRIKNSGYQNVYYGQASIVHFKGQSGLHKKSKKVSYYFYDSMKRFYRKHYQTKYNPLVTAMVYVGIQLKYWLTLVRMRMGRGYS